MQSWEPSDTNSLQGYMLTIVLVAGIRVAEIKCFIVRLVFAVAPWVEWNVLMKLMYDNFIKYFW